MQRVTEQVVELTEGEAVIAEGFQRLLDRGYDQKTAAQIILGLDIPETYRSPAEVTDTLMLGDFLEYLLS